MVGSCVNEVFRRLASGHSRVDSVSGSTGSTTAEEGAFQLCGPLPMNTNTRLGEAGIPYAVE